MIANDNISRPPVARPAAPSVEAWSGKDRGDENFPVGSILIAARLRAHVHAYYAFARNGDDIADSPALAPADKIARLDLMEKVLTGEQDDGAPSAARLRDSFAATGVPDIHARELLIAFRRDATKIRYANWAELLDYCRYSAAPVGRFLLDLHGESHATWPASDALCATLQVLNHMQDCARDLRDLDRCYIPQDWLKQAGLGTDDLARGETLPALRAVFDQMLDATDQLNTLAATLPAQVKSRRMRVECAIIVALARRLAAKLRHGDPLATRVKLTRLDFCAATLSGLRHVI
ncbi:squalene synthase HpnC [Acidocella sp.]|uniref:squalene synthase HpnC n=1 Tax=Acidocella sp. TaxID=50710 RepID=UPI002623C7F1|nr:squalene synthase HpnC [Acidocella sp.]